MMIKNVTFWINKHVNVDNIISQRIISVLFLENLNNQCWEFSRKKQSI